MLSDVKPPFREGYVKGPKDLRLYYRVEGTQGPTLICSNGIGVSTFFWEPFAHQLAGKYRVVRWDYRGHGRSDSPRDLRDISIQTCVDDLAALMDGLELKTAVHLGHSMGAQVGFEFYRRYPERVQALVPTLGPYRRAIETFLDSTVSLSLFAVMKAAIATSPRLIARSMRPFLVTGVAETFARRLGVVDPHLAPKALILQYMEHMLRLDLTSYLALAETLQTQDATDLLPQIKVPVLVVSGERDIFCPTRLAREMVEQIPGAELLLIPRGTHAALIEQPLLLSLRVQRFLEDRVFPRA